METKNQLNGKQSLIKGIINTVYGDIASPFFDVGNTVVANNITARGRLNVWLMSRTLMTVQTITDGGLYSPERVLKFDTNFDKTKMKKPGLETLSIFPKLIEHECIKITTLGEQNWTPLFQKKRKLWTYPDIDLLVTEQLNNFWKVYDLKIQYSLEHKKSKLV